MSENQADSTRLHVYKFGGTSLSSPDRIRQVIQLVEAEPTDIRKIVVVSAFGGVTNQLQSALEAALGRSREYRVILDDLEQRHKTAIKDLAVSKEKKYLQIALKEVWYELAELMDGVYLLRECTARTSDAIMGMGERIAAPIVAAAFRASGISARAVDSRSFIQTDDAFGEANVDFESTNRLVRETFHGLDSDTVAIVTGFMGATDSGAVTTLGRSGSDYTATILAGALGADRVVIWTDVDGVLSADPGLVPAAFTLPDLSYQEAAEMAYFGAKVLHPRTMRPIREKGIPLQIKNTMNPGADGTLIWTESPGTEGHVKAVTAIRGIALIMLEGAGMMGVRGISARMFAALAASDINVLLISQASSEQSICVGVRAEKADAATNALSGAFELELTRGDVSRIHAMEACAVVSVVGDQMRMKPGLAGRMFSTLGRANINVLAIAQGAAETNISAVVDEADIERAVRTLHEAFARSYERLHLFLIGPGVVGRRLLDILDRQSPILSDEYHLNLRLVGIANSNKVLWDAEGMPFGEAIRRLEEEGAALPLSEMMRVLSESRLERLVVIDATASDQVSAIYAQLLEHGIGVVTPNKRANTGDQEYYDRLQALSRHLDVPFLYETTVGAALPVIGPLRDLVRTGDTIHRIQGVLSGTLAFVFNEMKAGKTFSEAVIEARNRGFTEPDPRDDLSGEDVARKLLTLARESGLRLNRSDIAVESLIPIDLKEVDVQAFLDGLPMVDAEWAARFDGKEVQYVATLDSDGCRVGIEEVDASSPFSELTGTDNMVVFSTDRYAECPLCIRGAGAGPEITAAGIVADILKAAERML